MGGVYHEVRLAVAILSILSLLPVCLALFNAGVSRRHYIGTAAPSLLFAGLLLLFAWHYAGARLVYWDEFFWGGFVKHLVQENSLWAWGSVLPRNDSVLLYPPMVTILQALLQPMGTFSEPAIALGEGAVLLSATGVVIHLARQRGLSFWPVCFCALLTFGLLRSLGSPVRFSSYLFGYAESLQVALFLVPALALVFAGNTILTRTILSVGLPALILCKVTGCLLVLFILGATAVVAFLVAPAGQKPCQTGSDARSAGEGLSFWGSGAGICRSMSSSTFLSCPLGWLMLIRFVAAGHSKYVQAFFLTDLFAIPYVGSPVINWTAFLLLLSAYFIVRRCERPKIFPGSQYVALDTLLCGSFFLLDAGPCLCDHHVFRKSRDVPRATNAI